MTFERFLASSHADAETVQAALWRHLSEVTGDLTPDEMRDQLRAAVVDPELFENELATLPIDSASIERAALTYFSEIWTDERARASILAAFTNGKGTAPVVGAKVIVMYAMYIAAIHRALVALAGGPERIAAPVGPATLPLAASSAASIRSGVHGRLGWDPPRAAEEPGPRDGSAPAAVSRPRRHQARVPARAPRIGTNQP